MSFVVEGVVAFQIKGKWGKKVYFRFKTSQVYLDDLDLLKLLNEIDLLTTTPTTTKHNRYRLITTPCLVDSYDMESKNLNLHNMKYVQQSGMQSLL